MRLSARATRNPTRGRLFPWRRSVLSSIVLGLLLTLGACSGDPRRVPSDHSPTPRATRTLPPHVVPMTVLTDVVGIGEPPG